MSTVLTHHVYNSTSDVFKATEVRCAGKGIKFDRLRWIGSEQAPAFDALDPETVVVLDVTLDTLQRTFEFAWEWAMDGQEDSCRPDELFSTTPDKLRLLEGSEAFVSWTLRWRRIKLDANMMKAPVGVRNPKTSPGIALLFVAAQHPLRIKAIDYEKWFGWYIPGLECAGSRNTWKDTPYIETCFEGEKRQMMMSARWHVCADSSLSVPVFLE